jgi:hypothetical protein
VQVGQQFKKSSSSASPFGMFHRAPHWMQLIVCVSSNLFTASICLDRVLQLFIRNYALAVADFAIAVASLLSIAVRDVAVAATGGTYFCKGHWSIFLRNMCGSYPIYIAQMCQQQKRPRGKRENHRASKGRSPRILGSVFHFCKQICVDLES